MLHKYTLKQILLSAEWSDIRASYDCCRNPEAWAIAMLVMLMHGDRQHDKSYCTELSALLWQKFFSGDPSQTAELRDTTPDQCEELPEELCVFLNTIPVNAKTLRSYEVPRTSLALQDITEANERWCQYGNSPASQRLTYPLETIDPSKLRAFLSLDQVPRTGWTRTIPAFVQNHSLAESVAEHSIKTALLGVCAFPDNPADLLIAGICHDHAELVTGDIPPQQTTDKAHKHAMELETYRQMLSDIGNPPNASVLFDSFQRCIYNTTPDAHLLHIVDKLDMALQALTYENRFHINLTEFLVSATEDIVEAWRLMTHNDDVKKVL